MIVIVNQVEVVTVVTTGMIAVLMVRANLEYSVNLKEHMVKLAANYRTISANLME